MICLLQAINTKHALQPKKTEQMKLFRFIKNKKKIVKSFNVSILLFIHYLCLIIEL